MVNTTDKQIVEVEVTDKNRSLAKQIKQAEKLNRTFEKTIKLAKQIGSANQRFQVAQGLAPGLAAKNLAAGSPSVRLTNAATAGALAKIKAEAASVSALLSNTRANILKGASKAVKSERFVSRFDKFNQSGRNVATSKINAIALKENIELNKALIANNILTGKSSSLIAKRRKQLALQEKDLSKLTAVQKRSTQLSSLRTRNADKESQQLNRDFRVSNLTGDGGAALFKIQSQLIGNFLVMNQAFKAFSFGGQFIVELDEAFTQLQAITATTTTEMEGLKTELIAVSEQTKFTAVEIAQAATVLGQAGFSTTQIKSSIKDISLLATAVGTDMKTAVDLTTSTLAIFNMRAEETAHVADVITGAVNNSKLSLEKLSLGLQFAGNTAAQAGATFEETVSVLGAMANAGIRSGSTLGTGLRQVLVSFLKPTKKMSASLAGVGLTMEDLDVKSNGLVNVFETLRNAGFGATEAFEGMQVRSAAAFLAISNNIDVARDLETALILSSAAAEANATQMQSLANSGKVFKSVFGSSIVKALDPLKNALITIIKVASEALKAFNSFGAAVPIIGTAIAGFVGVAVAKQVGLLAVNLLRVDVAMKSVRGSTLALGAVMKAHAVLTGKSVALTKTMVVQTRLLSAALRFTLPGIALGAVTLALSSFSFGASKATAELDKLKAKTEESKGALETTESRIKSVSETIDRLNSRSATLRQGTSAMNQEILKAELAFGDLGVSLGDLNNPLDDTIDRLGQVKGELLEIRQLNLKDLILNQKLQLQGELKTGTSEGQRLSRLRSAVGRGTSERKIRADTPETLQVLEILAQTTTSFEKLKNQEASVGIKQSADLRRIIQEQLVILKGIKEARGEGSKALKDDKLSGASERVLDLIIARAESQFTNVKTVQSSFQTSFNLEGELNRAGLETSTAAQDLREAVGMISQFSSELSKELSGVTDEASRKKIRDDFKEALGTDGSPASQLFLKTLGATTEQIDVALDQFVVSRLDIINSTLFVEPRGAGTFGLTSGALSGLIANFKTVNNKLTKGLEPKTVITGEKRLSKAQVAEALSRPKSAVEELSKRRGKAGTKNDLRIRSIESQLAASRLGGASEGKFGSVQIKALNEEIERLKLENRNQAVDDLTVVSAQAQGLLAKARTKSTKADKAFKVKPIEATKGFASKAFQELTKAQNEAEASTKALEEAQAALGISLGATTLAAFDLTQEVTGGFQNWIDEAGKIDIGDTISQQLDNASSSFQSFFIDTINGTISIKEGFKSMSVSILKSLQKVAAKIAAEALLGQILSFGISLIPGATPGADSIQGGVPVPLSKPTQTFNSGGSIRRASAGFAVPGNSNRDSVPILARPGEFVLRNSAVQALGKDNLANLNAMGNNRKSQSPLNNVKTPVASAPVVTNVYVVSPDQKPALTSSDVIVTITEDLARGGPTKKLVKSIIQGRV